MTREQAIEVLEAAGRADDDDFPLLDAAIACAIHDEPMRDPTPVRALADAIAERLAERCDGEPPDDALCETVAGDFGLNGDLEHSYLSVGTDVIEVVANRRGAPGALAVFYLDAARRCGLQVAGVPFPGHLLLRVETPEGPVALDPFCHGRLVLPSELRQWALMAGLMPHVADRLDLLMAPITEREGLVRLQALFYARATRRGDFERAERAALRRALLDPEDHRPCLDVAAAREKQGALAGALEALSHAERLDEPDEAMARCTRDRVRARLN